jgi:ABC-type branched-subunit amino acid transport system ATPase component
MRGSERATPLLEVRGLSKRYGGVTALHRVSLSLEPGRLYGLIGPNGSGKSTLFDCITGLQPPDGGQVRFRGRRLDGLRPHQVVRCGIGRTFQLIRVFPALTARENLLAASEGAADLAWQRAQALLAMVQLEGVADEYAGNLSHGQQKLVELARACMRDPELILLDEPAAGVTPALRAGALRALRELRDRGKTVLLVEHDLPVVMDLCEHVFVLDHGEKLAEGPPALIRRDERVIDAYFGR